MKREIEPFRQGELDSLCGIYAVLNALTALCPDFDGELGAVIFRKMVKVLGTTADRPLAALHVGMSQDLVQAMLDVGCREVERVLDVKIRSRPFPTFDEHPTLGALWSCLQGELSHKQVAILGVSGADEHWTVAYAVTDKVIRLVDSQNWSVLRRGRCTTKPARTRFRLDPAAIVLVRRKG